MTERFILSMVLNERVFGATAFRKIKKGDDRRSVINVALFDVFSVLFARYGERISKEYDSVIREGLLACLDDQDFVDSISFATNGVKKVELRFARVEAMLREVL